MNPRLFALLRHSRLQFVQRTFARRDAPTTTATTEPAFGLVRIVDPDGRCAIVAVRGRIGSDALRSLWDVAERFDEIAEVHLDLTDATIEPGPWMAELEAFVDTLEAADVGVRVAGVSPDHPDLR